jgi:hypothetical protein
MSYDPHSEDAMFSQVLTRLKQQDQTLMEILAEVRKTNGRVTSLEQSREVSKAQIAVIATSISVIVGAVGWVAKTIFAP